MTDNNGGPWGNNGGNNSGNNSGKGGGPWGTGGGNNQPPQNIDEIFRKSQDQFKKMFGGPGGGNGGSQQQPPQNVGVGGLLIIAMAGVALWLLTGFYRVESDAEGIELLFGKWTNQGNPSEPGLHYFWPYPIGQVEKPVVTRENRITLGFSPVGSNIRSREGRRDVPQESTMVTGDENIVDIDFIVFWRIKDGGSYLFNVEGPESVVKYSAESVMREVIGQRPIVAALTEGRREIEQQALTELQELLDEYGTGVHVKNVQLLDVGPPAPVVDAFNDVQRARADKERLRNQADAYRNAILPEARGQAVKLVQEAEAYKQEVVNRATGDAERFTSVYNAYKTSKDVTTRRLYLETMEQVLQKANKVVIDGDAGSGVVPYLPLPEINKRQTGGAQ